MSKKFSEAPKFPGEVDRSTHSTGEVHIKLPGGIRAHTSVETLRGMKGKSYKVTRKELFS